MASSSHSGTPSAIDVRRARAARFSISPPQDFGSPSFSLGLEKFPPPPTFDDLEKCDEKHSSKRIRLLNDRAAPSFSLGLEEIQAPPTLKDHKWKETAYNNRQGQGPENGEVQQSWYPSRGDHTSPFERNPGSVTALLKTAEVRRHSQGRAAKVFSSPSFSLGLERNSPPAKVDGALSSKEKQASYSTGESRDCSVYLSSSHPTGEHASSLESHLLRIPSEKPKSSVHQKSFEENSASPECDLTLKRIGEVTSNHIKLLGDILPAAYSLPEEKIEGSPQSNPPVKSCDEQATKKIVQFQGLLPSPKCAGHVETEATADFDLTRRANHQYILRKRSGFEKTPPPTKKVSSSLRSESSSKRHENQILEHRRNKDEPSSSPSPEKRSLESEYEGFNTKRPSANEAEQKLDKRSREIKPVDSTKESTMVSPQHREGLIPKKEELHEFERGIEKVLLSSFSHTHCPPVIDLSQEREERSLQAPEWTPGVGKDSQTTQEYKIRAEVIDDSKLNDQQIEKEKVAVVDVSTPPPPPPLRMVSKGRLRSSYVCTESEFVQDSEDEVEFDHVPKRRKQPNPTQVKVEPPSTNCVEDLNCPPVESTSAADERAPGTPIADKKIFKRLRRRSSSARKDSMANQTPQDSIDVLKIVQLKKVKVEPTNPSHDLNKTEQTSFKHSIEEIADSSQRTNQDEFDDIEDFSEYELSCPGTRAHRDRRSLQSRIPSKMLSLPTPCPAGGRKPVLHIPGLDTSVVSKQPGKAKAESVTCLEAKFSNTARKIGNVKPEPITLSDDEEVWLRRSKVLCSRSLPPEVVKGTTSTSEKQKFLPYHERARARSDFQERDSGWKGKSCVTDGSDLWKSFTEEFSRENSADPVDGFASARNNIYKMCQSEDVRIADLLRERLPHFKPVDALLLDGGLDQDPVYIDYRNQFGRSQGMDSAAFAEIDCTQPQSRRKQKRSSSKSTKVRKTYAASSATTSSQRTTASRSPAKGKRKAWTLFRETKGRASASASASGKGYWIVEDGRRVYIKDGRTLNGRSAYAAYKKDSGKKSRKTRKKAATKSKR